MIHVLAEAVKNIKNVAVDKNVSTGNIQSWILYSHIPGNVEVGFHIRQVLAFYRNQFCESLYYYAEIAGICKSADIYRLFRFIGGIFICSG